MLAGPETRVSVPLFRPVAVQPVASLDLWQLADRLRTFPIDPQAVRHAERSESIRQDPVPICSAHSADVPAVAIGGQQHPSDRSPGRSALTGRGRADSLPVPTFPEQIAYFRQRSDLPVVPDPLSCDVQPDDHLIAVTSRSDGLEPVAVRSIARSYRFPDFCSVILVRFADEVWPIPVLIRSAPFSGWLIHLPGSFLLPPIHDREFA